MIGTWREAHRVAQIAATHAHSDLNISRTEYVDVFQAIRDTGTPIQLQRLPNLFGLYVSPASDGPGILLNSGLLPSILRHTAAHELGHQHFGHGNSIDRMLDPWNGQMPIGGWVSEEISAEAFAAWFLMPRPAIRRCLSMLGLERPGTAIDVYRIATLLGATFRGLCRHLVTLGLADSANAELWAKTSRGQLRQKLAGMAVASKCRGEIHVIESTLAGFAINVGIDDVLVLPGASFETVDPPLGLEVIKSSENGRDSPTSIDGGPPSVYWRVTAGLCTATVLQMNTVVDTGPTAKVRLQPVLIREGIDLSWLESRQDHYSAGD
jgi:hypothetical protein